MCLSDALKYFSLRRSAIPSRDTLIAIGAAAVAEMAIYVNIIYTSSQIIFNNISPAGALPQSQKNAGGRKAVAPLLKSNTEMNPKRRAAWVTPRTKVERSK